MTGFAAALRGEGLKARRANMPWITAVGISLAPLTGGLFMIILKDPEQAQRLGLIGAKAQITAGIADWPTYFGVLAQATAIGGLLLFGLVAIWVFGREFSDKTAKDLLALPTSRTTIVAAKFTIITVWSAILAAIVYGLGVVIGAVIGLPHWSADIALHALWTHAVISALTIILVTPFALVACVGRGYLPPVGSMFLALFLAQIIAALGWGAYFPWSIPALYSGVAGPSVQDLSAVSYLLVVLAGLSGLVGSFAWWQFADQT
jgi:ABC-2 type transport system permease protein